MRFCSPWLMMNESIHRRILQACYAFMVPIARFLLMHGISYPEFSHICRIAFARVASDEYGLRGRPTNVARIAAITGISRKEVARIRDESANYDDNPRVRLSPLSDVLHVWYTHERYLGSDGTPKELALTGKGANFGELVKSCAGDLPSSALRAELIRSGAVVQTADGLYRPTRRESVPTGFDEKLITSLSFNLKGLASTIAHNSSTSRKGPGRIERFIESGALDEASKAALRGLVRSRIVGFSESIDDLFAQYDPEGVPEGERVAVGVYYYED